MKWDIRIHITLATCLKKRKDVLQVNIDQGGCNEKICERIYCSISAVLNRKKLKWLRMVVIIPALVGIITLLVIMINFNESYNEAVKNVSVASKFNFSFSEDMDYKMYRIVIGAESFDTMKPYEEIKEAKELVKELNKNAVTDESKLRTRQIGKLLDNLKISIEEIEHSDLKNDYMENNQRLRLNVNVFTEIIKEKVSEYIYYEIGNMESMRVKLEKEIMHTITITLIAVLFLSLITWKLSKLISQSISYPVRQLCEMTKEVAQEILMYMDLKIQQKSCRS